MNVKNKMVNTRKGSYRLFLSFLLPLQLLFEVVITNASNGKENRSLFVTLSQHKNATAQFLRLLHFSRVLRQSDYLFSVLLNGLITGYMSVAAAISDGLEELESALLADTGDRDIGVQMQELRRDYMQLKRTVLPLKEQYSRLFRSDSSLLHRVNRPFFNDVNDHLLNVAQNIDICRETLSSLMDLYISNNDLRMNDIMKRLTVVSTIFIPLTFLVGVWG